MQERPLLTKSTLPANVINTQYAVRGTLVLKANQLEKQLKDPNFKSSAPFSRITYCNIGNPQELGQPPLTFYRQVISLVENPSLLQHASQLNLPSDVISRAKHLLQNISGGTGAYSGSQGVEIIREEVASYIANRDLTKQQLSDPSYVKKYVSADNIFLSDGASPAIQRCLQLIIRDKKDGIMVPIPQYPLYSASIAMLGGSQVDYYLNENNNWELDVKELERSFEQSQAKNGIYPRALVVINPGNPTGQCLSAKNIEQIIDFAHRKNIVLLADEVYQENVYVKESKPFTSFKKVKHSMGSKYSNLELFSFHSVSKGFTGECGKRGGYVDMDGIDPDVKDQYYKLASIGLCPNVIGQIMVGLMVNPPKQGDPSYPTYVKERDEIYNSLKRRAQLVTNTLNKCEGIKCNPAEGAMYAFPQITLPEKAIAAAKSKEQAPDLFYCLELLENTGICVVPGSGFGQQPGTFHFRTTFLPQESHLEKVLNDFKTFHSKFLSKYK